jgi:hypothetical protein
MAGEHGRAAGAIATRLVNEELSVRGVIAAIRIPFKKGERRDRNVEVALATGVLSEVQGQILIASLKDQIVGSARKRHADLCLMPEIRAHRHHARVS